MPYYRNTTKRRLEFQLGSKRYRINPGEVAEIDRRFADVLMSRQTPVEMVTLAEAASAKLAAEPTTVRPVKFVSPLRDTTMDRVSARLNPELLEEAGVNLDDELGDDEPGTGRRRRTTVADDIAELDASDEPLVESPDDDPAVAAGVATGSGAVAAAVRELAAAGVAVSPATSRAKARKAQRRAVAARAANGAAKE